MAAAGAGNCPCTLRKPSTMLASERSRLSALDGSAKLSTTGRFACIAEKTKFVPPASSVMTMRLSLLYCCMVVYARAAARLESAVQEIYRIAASGTKKLSCTEL